MLRDFIIIAQSNIPLSTAAHTHYVSVTFPILFQKKNQNFWALFGAPGALANYFRIPLLPLRVPIFSRRFDLFSHFLLHGTTFHLLLGRQYFP